MAVTFGTILALGGLLRRFGVAISDQWEVTTLALLTLWRVVYLGRCFRELLGATTLAVRSVVTELKNLQG